MSKILLSVQMTIPFNELPWVKFLSLFCFHAWVLQILTHINLTLIYMFFKLGNYYILQNYSFFRLLQAGLARYWIVFDFWLPWGQSFQARGKKRGVESNQDFLCQLAKKPHMHQKTGSDRIIYLLSRYSFLLGFIMSKNCETLSTDLLIWMKNEKSFFNIIKPQKKRVSIESMKWKS